MSEPEADLTTSGLLLAHLQPLMRELHGHTVEQLAELAEQADSPLAQRHAAGSLLGMLGDPRITPEAPAMVDVPAAEVWMGLPPERLDEVTAEWAHMGVVRDWIAKEVPAHRVQVGAFRIGRYPVTNAEWLPFALAHPEIARPTAWAHGIYPSALGNHPVYTVTPAAADAFVAWLAARTGRPFRLPTEAEWEYAASGGDGRQYPWGDEWRPEFVNTAELGPLTATPVGIFVESNSVFGAADMAGNVEEYVADDYVPYPGAPVIVDDLIDTHGDIYRIARGGSFSRHGDLARCARRHGWYPSDHFAMGLRVAESVL